MNRSDCKDGPRPCHRIACRYHTLSSMLTPSGKKRTAEALARHIDNVEGDLLAKLDTVPDTCALDVAERGEHTYEEVAEALSITKRWAREIEGIARRKFEAAVETTIGFDDIRPTGAEVSIMRRLAGTKVCTSCGLEKCRLDFYKKKDAVVSQCKECRRAADAEWQRAKRRGNASSEKRA